MGEGPRPVDRPEGQSDGLVSVTHKLSQDRWEIQEALELQHRQPVEPALLAQIDPSKVDRSGRRDGQRREYSRHNLLNPTPRLFDAY